MLKIFLFYFILNVYSSRDPWKLVGEVLERQPFLNDCAITVGNETRLYAYIKGNITMEQSIMVQSSTKMVSSTIFMKLYQDGKMSLEDYVYDYIDWWTRDTNDSRSLVQIKHLLTFTSGFNFGLLSAHDRCLLDEELIPCVKRKYERFPHETIPGVLWDYNEFHLQIMGVIALNITNMTLPRLLRSHLEDLNMTTSYYRSWTAPDLSGDLVSNGADYEQFMLRFFGSEQVVNETTKALMFADHTPNVETSKTSYGLRISTGTYGLTNYYECPYWYFRGYPKFPKTCYEQNVHSDPGAYGWWPLYDLKHRYFFQVIADDTDIETGVVYGFFVRMLIKPFIDRAIKKQPQPSLDSIDWDAWGRIKQMAKIDSERAMKMAYEAFRISDNDI